MFLCDMAATTARAVGRFGPGLLVLRAVTDLLWCPAAADILEVTTHEVLYADRALTRAVPLARGRRFACRRTGRPYVLAHLGAVPLVFTPAGPDTVRCHAGRFRPPEGDHP